MSVTLVLKNYYLQAKDDAGSVEPASSVNSQVAEPAKVAATLTPATQPSVIGAEKTAAEPSSTAPSGSGLSEEVLASEREAFFKRFDLATLGEKQLSDGDFNAIVAYLNNDPVLLEQFLQQYRENTNPERAKRLAQLLESFDDEAIAAVAEDLIFSGEISSQQAGLELLSDQQVHNPAARELVSQVLQVESDPQVLVSALNALATPGVASAEQTERLISQFAVHATNEDEIVRGLSLDMMGRWGGNRNLNEHYLNSLSDSSERVRRSAVFLLGNSKHPDDAVKAALRGVLENSNESQRLRRNALVNLKKHGLSKEEEALYRERINAGN